MSPPILMACSSFDSRLYYVVGIDVDRNDDQRKYDRNSEGHNRRPFVATHLPPANALVAPSSVVMDE
jgi:hypothetical protein